MGVTNQGSEVWVIVVAAGSGSRFGGPKQFSDLAGQRVVDRAVAVAGRHASGVVVVLPAGSGSDTCVAGPADSVVLTVAGDTSRSGSVRCGLAAVPDTADVVLVHDGARPLASDELYRSVIAAVGGGAADAVVPAVAVTDTIRRRDGGIVDRSQLVAVQTPQAFRAEVLRDAHASGSEATDDAALVELAGGKVVLVNGDPRNLKITTPLDLDIAEALLRGGDTAEALLRGGDTAEALLRGGDTAEALFRREAGSDD